MTVIFFVLAIIGATVLMGIIVYVICFRIMGFAKALDATESEDRKLQKAFEEEEKRKFREVWLEDKRLKAEEAKASAAERKDLKDRERKEDRQLKAAEKLKEKTLVKKKKPKKKK